MSLTITLNVYFLTFAFESFFLQLKNGNFVSGKILKEANETT